MYTGLKNHYVGAFAASGTNVFAGSYDAGVFLFDSGSKSWSSVNTGLTKTGVYALAVMSDGAGGMNLFAGTLGVWMRPFSDMVAAVEDDGDLAPSQFVLKQNYPNPFNPSTTLKYQLPTDSKVSLRVFNTLGQVVTVLADGIQQAGYKQAEWNAGPISSGVYFYRLEAASISDPSRSYNQVKKLIYLK